MKYPRRTRRFTTTRICGFRAGSQWCFPAHRRVCCTPEIPAHPRGLIPTDRAAFAPRVGLAWDVRGDGKWLVSSAYGIFYDPYYTGEGGPLQDPISAPPYLQTPQVSTPNFADPFNGQNPFNGTFSQDMTLLVLNPHLRLPYAQDWNLNIERALGNDLLLEVGYIGQKARNCRGLSRRIRLYTFLENRRKTTPTRGACIQVALSPEPPRAPILRWARSLGFQTRRITHCKSA